MSDEQFGFGAVDFRFLLLDLYKKLGIADKEALVLLMVDHLGLQGNKLITASDLSFKMSMPVEELDSILASLLKRDLISINGGVTSVAPLREKLLAQFKQELAKAKASPISKKRAEALGRLRDYAEKRFNRTLSPLEVDALGSFLDDGYPEDDITACIEAAIADGKKNMKAVDRALRTLRRRSDFEKEGYSGVSRSWDKDIERTIELSRTKWLDDDDD